MLPAKPCAATAHGHISEAVARESPQEAADRDAPFQARQGQACALMDAETKGQVAIVLASQLQYIRIGKLRRIAVCSANAQRHQRAFL